MGVTPAQAAIRAARNDRRPTGEPGRSDFGIGIAFVSGTAHAGNCAGRGGPALKGGAGSGDTSPRPAVYIARTGPTAGEGRTEEGGQQGRGGDFDSSLPPSLRQPLTCT